jgi:hypothetical protein
MRAVGFLRGRMKRHAALFTWFPLALLVLPFELVLSAQQAQPQASKDLRPSPVIRSISLATAPLRPFPSTGELWFTTWADDGNLYGTWGDGSGPTPFRSWSLMTDCGVVKFTGDLPNLTPTILLRDAPTQFEPRVDDKPSSVLFLGGRLYGQFHSPLGDPRIGYLAYSDDYGQSWTRVGYYLPDVPKPLSASPWTKDLDSPLTSLPFINQVVPRMFDNTSLRDSPFRCLFFINMGRNYELNTDGYVYGLGIGKEWDWSGDVYLARVEQKRILRYSAWEYFAGTGADGKPLWSNSQADAKPVPGLYTTDQGSAIYHPGVKRYLFLNNKHLFDAPEPWGPWTVAGDFPAEPPEWQKGYQPGIVSKGLGPDSFWFTMAGQAKKPHMTYNFHVGQMVMHLASPPQ